MKVSEIGLGCLEFGRRLDEQASKLVVDQALDSGINFFDTADVYTDGRSEEIVGQALKGKRSSVIIASKFGVRSGDNFNQYGGSRLHIMEEIDATLTRLGTDYIDLYYLHYPDPSTPVEETLRTLDSLVRSGKVRHIACSNFNAWQLCEALWTSKSYNLESFAGVQVRYNMLNRQIESELVPCCQAFDVGILPWEPLAGGFLTGKYQRGKSRPADTRLGAGLPVQAPRKIKTGLPAGGRPSILSDGNFEILDKLQKYSTEHGHQVGELAIAWLLAQAWVSSVIAGASSSTQVLANVTAADWKLTARELTEVNALLD